MIDIIRLIIALIIPTFVGFTIITAMLGKKGQLSIVQHLSLSYLLGFGVISLEMLIMGLFGIKLSFSNTVLVTLLIMFPAMFFAIKNRAYISFVKHKVDNGNTLLNTLFLSLISVRVLFVIYDALVKPIVGVDAFANWSIKAKIFFFEQGLVLDKSKEYFLGSGAVQYPLNLPLFESWIFSSLGYWNDALVKIIFPLFFVVALFLIYSSLIKITDRTTALLGTYLLSSLPMLLHHATIEYADMPMSVFFFASFLLLLDYLDTKESFYLYLSAAMAGIATWTKGEGLPLALAILVVLFISQVKDKVSYSNVVKRITGFIAIMLVFKLPWEIVNKIYSIPKSAWQRLELDKAIVNLGRIPTIYDQIQSKFLFYGNWNIAWFLLLVIIIISLLTKYKQRKTWSLLTLTLLFTTYVVMYYITPNYVWLLDGTTLNRNTIVMMPILIYFICLNIFDIFSSKNGAINTRSSLGKKSSILLSIIIPVYNEETHIGEVISKIKAVTLANNIQKEILIVDDGSVDNTPQILKQYAGDKAISVFSSSCNCGKGAAIRIGIKNAKGDILLIQDADLEYDPEAYTSLIEPIISGNAKVVYGSRFKGSILGMKFPYWLANKVLTTTANILFNANITDEATCYKIFSSDILKSIDLKCNRFEFCPEVTAKVLKSGEKIFEVPITYRSRSVEEGKKIGWKDGFSAFWTLVKYRFVD